ncbi:inorganic diphosphatase [Patescibacteria group bacterium]|nr:inorganic diphosphatase [Patescibacteria group bacterium]
MSYEKIPLGDKAPQIINAVVEIPKGSHHKYEFDEVLDEIRLDRVLHSPVFYPTDYGFVPHTRAEDGDHLDVLVFVTDPLFPGCVVRVRVVGALDMEDNAGKDYKILGVVEKDPKLSNIQNVNDIDEHYKKEIVHFFEEYKKLEGKWAKINGWLEKEEAYRIIKEGQDRYVSEKR